MLFPGPPGPCGSRAGPRAERFSFSGVSSSRSASESLLAVLGGQAGENRTGLHGAAPLDDVARVEALTAQQRSFGAGVGQPVVLLQDGALVLGR